MNSRNITKIVRNMMLYKNKMRRRELNENEFEMVRYLTKHKDGLSQQELANYLNVDKSLVTRMVKKLYQLSYIEIDLDKTDSRKKLIVPTSKAFLVKSEESNEEIIYYNMIMKPLSDEERKTLDSLIEKIYLESKRLRKERFEE